MTMEDNKCGNCLHYRYGDENGVGWCDVGDVRTYCSYTTTSCEKYETFKGSKWQYISVLDERLKARTFVTDLFPILRSKEYDEFYEAIEFAIKYMKGNEHEHQRLLPKEERVGMVSNLQRAYSLPKSGREMEKGTKNVRTKIPSRKGGRRWKNN